MLKNKISILVVDDEIDIWISENDNGLWDAWNKGFKLARGDFVGIVVDGLRFTFPPLRFLKNNKN